MGWAGTLLNYFLCMNVQNFKWKMYYIKLFLFYIAHFFSYHFFKKFLFFDNSFRIQNKLTNFLHLHF